MGRLTLFDSTVWADLPALGASITVLLGLVALGEVLRRYSRLSAEATRRFVHLGVGLFVAAVPLIFAGPTLVYVLAALFTAINGLAWWQEWLPAMHGARHRSLGTVTFPLALLVVLPFCWTEGRLFVLSVAFLVLAVADPLAAWAGEKGRTKSLRGSLTFFASAGGVTLATLFALRAAEHLEGAATDLVLLTVLVALATTAAEALGRQGWDNLFIVIAAVVVLIYGMEQSGALGQMLAGIVAGGAFGYLAWQLRFLTPGGALAGGLLAASIVGLGGLRWIVPSFAFFFLSSALSKLGGKAKASSRRFQEKGDVRDAGQVWANGGVAWVLLLLYAFQPTEALYGGFVGAFAAAAADTWATELGTLARGRPWHLRTGKRVPRGTSGAVSLVGTLAALGGAAVIGGSAWPFAPSDHVVAFVGGAVLFGFVGAFVDSLLGATLQVQYRDLATGALAECPADPRRRYVRVQGWTWMTGDRVNFLCTTVGAVGGMGAALLA